MEMQDLLRTIVSGLVENKEAIEIKVDEPNEEKTIVFHLHVAQEDMGRIIGKQGKIAKSIRVLMRSYAARQRLKVSVEIE